MTAPFRAAGGETAFCAWMRKQPALDFKKGIVRTDLDHVVLRYKTAHGRDFQLEMIIEVKEHGADLNLAQRDALSFLNQIASRVGRNMHGAATRATFRLRSKLLKRTVNVRWLGVHLLQFQATDPDDSSWIAWDYKHVSRDTLLGLLALDLDPYDPSRSMVALLRDRHRSTPHLPGVE